MFLHGCFLLYSCSGILSKLAAQTQFLSLGFLLLYGGSVLVLLGYAIIWQQALKRFSLITAFANKSVLIVWGMIWGSLLFHEAISWNMIVGALVVFAGVYIVVSSDG
ncbi:MAG: transporter [Anaerotruncus sp.]|uniref:Transporter n=2 Tax=Oscillospiraceae TaxID=216572 RepID=A0A845SPX9_9FIRM|nr:transporter [Anaerotruncus sp.]NDO37665.1 transporter [Anaerotruncus colihominis]